MLSLLKLAMLAICAIVMSGAAFAEEPETPAPVRPAADNLELMITSIRGNQELPRVMTIVPWKDPAMGNLVGKPVNSLIDEVLTPLDRDVFRRHTSYFDQLYATPETDSR
jgi:hypothetical protein